MEVAGIVAQDVQALNGLVVCVERLELRVDLDAVEGREHHAGELAGVERRGANGGEALDVLFRLEDMSGLHPVDTDKGLALVIDEGIPGSQKIEYALIAWKSMRDDLASGAISREEYEDWRASFSE